jgi:UDP-N-acetyl-D-glucosamine dehydrogenase
MQTVIVQGLGFVGAVMSLVLANSSKKYQVIGVDLPSNQDVIDNLNSGIFPIESSDPKVDEYFKNAILKGNFRATSDISAYKDADVVVVDINLDVQKGVEDKNLGNDYSVNLEGFKKAMYTIAENCKDDVLVLVETTVPPGTCEKIVKPIFEEVFEKRALSKKYKIGHSYERVMPGPGYVDSIQNFYRVYSGIDEQSANAAETFLKTIISTDEYPLTRLGNTTATEMAKVLENSFRAMNIAFIQEWTEFAEISGVNLFEVIDAIRMRPTHKNIMRPGLGVGGYCLTKDPLLASWASQALFGGKMLPQSEKAVKINDAMPLHSYRMIENHFSGELQDKRVLILGVSYLQDVGDTRFTPVEAVYKRLLAKRAEITLHDPYVSKWEEFSIYTESEEMILGKEYDAVIIGTPHSTYLNGGLLDRILSMQKAFIVFDPHGCISVDTKKKFLNHSFKITGRGDV